MSKTSERIIVIGVCLITIFSILSYCKISDIASDVSYIYGKVRLIEDWTHKSEDRLYNIGSDLSSIYYDVSDIDSNISRIKRQF